MPTSLAGHRFRTLVLRLAALFLDDVRGLGRLPGQTAGDGSSNDPHDARTAMNGRETAAACGGNLPYEEGQGP
jgi:hypothetical protein